MCVCGWVGGRGGGGDLEEVDKSQKGLRTDEIKEMIRMKPSPISACEDRMLRVVEFDSTHTQGSSKYFLQQIKESTKSIRYLHRENLTCYCNKKKSTSRF